MLISSSEGFEAQNQLYLLLAYKCPTQVRLRARSLETMGKVWGSITLVGFGAIFEISAGMDG